MYSASATPAYRKAIRSRTTGIAPQRRVNAESTASTASDERSMMSTDILFDLQRSEQVINHKKPIPSPPVVDEREAPIPSVSNDRANRVYQMRQLYDKTDIGRHDQKDIPIPPRHPQSSDSTTNDAGMQGICIQGSMANLQLNGKMVKKPSRSHALAARMSAAKAIYAAKLSDRSPHRINNFDNNGSGSISSISSSSADASIPSTSRGFDNDGFSVNKEADIDRKVDLSMFGEPFFIPDSCPRSSAPSSQYTSEMTRMSKKVSMSSTKQRPMPEQVNSASTSSGTHMHTNMPSSDQPMVSTKYKQTKVKTHTGTSMPPMPPRAQNFADSRPIQDTSESSLVSDSRQTPLSSYKVGSDRRASRMNRIVSTIDERVVPVGTHKRSAVYNEDRSVEIARSNPARYQKANLRRTKANHKQVKNLNEPGEEFSPDADCKTDVSEKDHDYHLQDSTLQTKPKGIVQQRLEMMKATGVFKSERIANEREEAARAEAETKRREENRVAAVEARNRLRAKRRAAAERAEEKRTTEKRAEEEKHEGERTATKKALAQRIEAVRKAAAEKAAAEAKAAEEATPKTESERKERLAEEQRIATEKAKQARLEQERLEQERLEAERLAVEKAKQERLEQERLAEEQRIATEKAKQARLEQERLEQERLEAERLAVEKAKQERLEQERLAEEQRIATEKAKQARLEQERLAEEQRIATEKAKQERLEQERLAEEQRIATEKAKQARLEQERLAEEQRIATEKAEQERLAEQKRIDEEKAEQKRLTEAQHIAAVADAKKKEKEEVEKKRLENESVAADNEILDDVSITDLPIWLENAPKDSINSLDGLDLAASSSGEYRQAENPVSRKKTGKFCGSDDRNEYVEGDFKALKYGDDCSRSCYSSRSYYANNSKYGPHSREDYETLQTILFEEDDDDNEVFSFKRSPTQHVNASSSKPPYIHPLAYKMREQYETQLQSYDDARSEIADSSRGADEERSIDSRSTNHFVFNTHECVVKY